jgi:hypothetical protein
MFSAVTTPVARHAASHYRLDKRGTSCSAYRPPNRANVDPSLDILGQHRSLFEDVRSSIEMDIDRMERRMERAMESMDRVQREHGGSRQYKREWRNEGSSGHEYIYESVQILRTPARTLSTRDSAPVGYFGVMMATAVAVLYVQRARAFWAVAEDTVYAKKEKAKLAAIAPLLALFSSKFRDEWRRADDRLRRRQTQRELEGRIQEPRPPGMMNQDEA